jgi:hypothetical protein
MKSENQSMKSFSIPHAASLFITAAMTAPKRGLTKPPN